MIKPNSLIRTNIFLSKLERDGFMKLAKQRKCSAASLMRQVLDAFLGIDTTPAPVVFKNQPPMR